MIKRTVNNMFICSDCSVDTSDINEYYMVLNSVWAKVATKHDRMLCIGCLEDRLKRKLTPKDFSSAPINILGVKSERLKQRLGI